MEGSWNNIPQELKDKRQWVCYIMPFNPQKGKPDKIPINPHTLWGARSNDPNTWGSFQEAIEQIGKIGRSKDETGKIISSPIVGPGFMFNDNGIVGTDFDHCIVDGKMDPWVAGWIQRFNSYVEFSPSDTGVHILCYGKLPGKSIKLDVAEIYEKGRFFTVTGKGPPRPLCEAQQAIDDLYTELSRMRAEENEAKKSKNTIVTPIDTPTLEDAEIIEKARNSKNGANFSALWEGDISGYKSQSEADLALCSHLAFWTQKDQTQMDQLFRQSGLMREKWDRPQAGSTYGKITIEAAIDSCREVYEPKRKRGRPRKSDGESKRDNRPSLYMATLEEFLQENHISVRYNQITHDVEVTGVSDEYNPETLNDDLCVILHDQLKQNFKCNKNLVGDLLGVISGKHRYNPALDLINSVQWDGVQRMDGVYKILNISPTDWLSRTLIWKWFIQGVSILENDPRHPFGADGILVLQGPQGCGKTWFCSAVGIRPDLVKLGQHINNRDKDTTRRCVSAWVTELGELETTLRSDLEQLKAFLTAERDEYRLPYGRADQHHARRTSFIATCNSERFLIDPTGSRRFWTVPIEKIDLDELRRFDFLQVWAEAKVYAEAHPQGFRLTPEEQAALAQRNTRHEKPLKAQLEVEDIISKAESVPGYEWRWETVSAFKMEYEILRPYSVEQIGKALEKVGIFPEQKRINGSPKKVRELPFPKYGVRALA